MSSTPSPTLSVFFGDVFPFSCPKFNHAKHEFSRPPTEQGLFGKLPVELRLQVFYELDYGSAIFLAATNHYFRRLIDPLSLVSDEDKVIFIREAEHFRQHGYPFPTQPEAGFACSGCFRVRKVQHFENILVSYYEKLPPPHCDDEVDDKHRRPPWQFCTDCAKTPRVFSHGSEASIFEQKRGGIVWRRTWNCEACRIQRVFNLKLRLHGCFNCGHCVVWFMNPQLSPHPNVCPTCKGDVLVGTSGFDMVVMGNLP